MEWGVDLSFSFTLRPPADVQQTQRPPSPGVQLTSPSQWGGSFPSTFEDILGTSETAPTGWAGTGGMDAMKVYLPTVETGDVKLVSPLGMEGMKYEELASDYGPGSLPHLLGSSLSDSASTASPSPQLSFGRSPSPPHDDMIHLTRTVEHLRHSQSAHNVGWTGMGMGSGMGMVPSYSVPSFASLSDIQSVDSGSGTSTPKWEWDGEEEVKEESLPSSPMMSHSNLNVHPLRHTHSAPSLLSQFYASDDTISSTSQLSSPDASQPTSKPTRERSSPPQGPRIYRCWMPDCSKCYGTGAGLRYHLRHFHKLTHIPRQPPIRIARIKPDFYECLKCGKRYGTAAGLRYHKKTFVHPADASGSVMVKTDFNNTTPEW
ncbi:hypothetical protein HDV00_004795 [Rhizophlyctis rosea]|nr:hypothetical protein HDV00_004795 [Rhizophlyctis rosea]